MGSNITHLRPCCRNDIAQEERNCILRNSARGATRRHKKTMAKRSQRISPVEINAECPHRAKQEVVIKDLTKKERGMERVSDSDSETSCGTYERQASPPTRLQSRKEPATPQPFWRWLRPRGTGPSASEHAEEHGTGVRTPRC